VPKVNVVAADSAAAILDEKFEPVTLVASVAVLVKPPYREPYLRIAKPIFKEVDTGFEVIVGEAELCQEMLSKIEADVVHLDMTLGGVPIEALSPVELSNLRGSRTGKANILKILPRIRKIAAEIKRVYDVEMLAIGKESVPVRVAELTAGAEAVLFAAQKVVAEKQGLMLGLPLNCQPRVGEDGVYLQSLMAGEHDLRGFALDMKEVLVKVKLTETFNPCARGFRALKIQNR
jgi:hypothetical protein